MDKMGQGNRVLPHGWRVVITVFIIVLPILLQLIIGPRMTSYEDSPQRWLELKLNTSVIYFCWSFLAAAFILGTGFRVLLLAFPIVLSLFVSAYLLFTGENIEYEVFAAIHNTNAQEALEFLYSPIVLFALLLVAVSYSLIHIFLLRPDHEPFQWRKVVAPVPMALLAAGTLGLTSEFFISKDSLYRAYPLGIAFYQKQFLRDQYLFQKEYSNIQYAFDGELKLYEGANEVIILVIGESARSQSMSLYGYARDTTPEMLKAMDDAGLAAAEFGSTAAAVSTSVALPRMLSTASVEDGNHFRNSPSIIHMFNDVGFETVLLSNQEKSGRHNDAIALMLNQSTSIFYLSGNAARRKLDEHLLGSISKFLAEPGQRKLIVVHLMGSHWRYADRYPPAFDQFTDGSTIVDSYDNSILYTDYIIGNILSEMKKTKVPTALVYTSDHGENLNDYGDGNYMHSVKEATPFELSVPFFFAANRKYFDISNGRISKLIKRIGARTSHDNISHTLLGLAGIYDSRHYDSRRDLTSSNFEELPRMAVDRNMEIINVDKYFKNQQKEY